MIFKTIAAFLQALQIWSEVKRDMKQSFGFSSPNFDRKKEIKIFWKCYFKWTTVLK